MGSKNLKVVDFNAEFKLKVANRPKSSEIDFSQNINITFWIINHT
jgi:hypothetical protein